SAKDIDDACGQGRFRPDQSQIDAFLLGKVGERIRISDRNVLELLLARRAGVTRGEIDTLQAGRLGQAPGKSVFTTTGTDDEKLHSNVSTKESGVSAVTKRPLAPEEQDIAVIA